MINILAADPLMNAPRLYATFLQWLLSELFELLPEVGDLDKPKLVFFFDEAHLLFKDAQAALIERIELVVRLVRSKRVGVYSSPKTHSTCPTPCWVSWATGCSMPCAPSCRATRRRCNRRPAPCAPTRLGTSPRRSPSWPWARPWSACSIPRAGLA